MTLSPEEKFRVDYFLQIMDQAPYSLGTKFEQFQKYEKIFGFLFDDSLMVSCANLEDSLTHGDHSNIVGIDLFAELKTLKEIL